MGGLNTLYRRITAERDIVVALALLVLSSLFSVLAYAKIVELEKPLGPPIATIQAGKHTYLIRRNDICIGQLVTELSHNKSWQLITNAALRAAYQDKHMESALVLNASFNPLGQLTDASLSASTAQAKLNINFSNVNPITISVDAHSGDRAFSKQLSVPGPLELIDKGSHSNSYTLRYRPVGDVAMLSSRHLSQSIIAPLGLSIDEHNAAHALCSRDGELDLSELINLFQTLLPAEADGALQAGMPRSHD